jgi:ubiquinone/menaquinone biosynthesis C-methylase UbiE
MKSVAQNATEEHPFRGVAPVYERFRLAWPERLVRRVADLAGLAPGDAVLDLGSGPGSLAIPFAKLGMDVTAADPDPEMLAAARVAAECDRVRLNLWQGGSAELTAEMGPFALVAIGRAFHWMDGAATLAMLDRIVTPKGAVVFFHDAHPDRPENAWFKLGWEILRRHRRKSDEGRAAFHRRYEPFLLASAFRTIDTLSVIVRRSITIDEIVGRAFTQSAAVAFGENAPLFEAELRAGLAALSPAGRFTEIAELKAVMGRRGP